MDRRALQWPRRRPGGSGRRRGAAGRLAPIALRARSRKSPMRKRLRSDASRHRATVRAYGLPATSRVRGSARDGDTAVRLEGADAAGRRYVQLRPGIACLTSHGTARRASNGSRAGALDAAPVGRARRRAGASAAGQRAGRNNPAPAANQRPPRCLGWASAAARTCGPRNVGRRRGRCPASARARAGGMFFDSLVN